MSRLKPPVEMATPAIVSISDPRENWVDTAKAISIVLVVLWHTVGDELYLFRLLVFLRMPLFFFVAGLFARSALSKNWSTFLKYKISNWIYLYIVWYFLYFILVKVPDGIVDGEGIENPKTLSLFYEPIRTLWFIYVLAIIFFLSKIFSNLPFYITMILIGVGYYFGVASGNWDDPNLPERIVRIAPFFFMGVFTLDIVGKLKQVPRLLGVFLFAAYLLGANVLLDTKWEEVAIATFLVTCLGIASVILFSLSVDNARWTSPLKFIGARTLHIYVMHRIAIDYLHHGFEFLNIQPGIGRQFAQAAIIIPLCLIAGHFVKRYAPMLFSAPWTIRPVVGSHSATRGREQTIS